MKNHKETAFISGIAIVTFSIFSCNPSPKNESAEENTLPAEETATVVTTDYWLIDEHQMNEVPFTSKAKKNQAAQPNAGENKEAVATGQEVDETEAYYEIYTVELMEEDLMEVDYESIESIEVTEIVIPLDETQTLTSYSKKGKAEDTLQVISTGTGEIEQVIFTHKKHKDVYDVSAGMSGKEVKRLRKEMKHMVKKGQVFLYDDSSNIMYLMDAQDMEGNEVTEVDIENMDVQAIIWKDKKHHKK